MQNATALPERSASEVVDAVKIVSKVAKVDVPGEKEKEATPAMESQKKGFSVEKVLEFYKTSVKGTVELKKQRTTCG